MELFSGSYEEKKSYSSEIILIAGLLTFFGLLAVYSSSSIPAFQKTGDAFYFARKQAVIALAGFGFIIAIQYMPIKWIERSTLPILAISLILVFLTLTPFFEHNVNGASRWIKLGKLTFQPAELCKLSIILFLAKNLARPAVNIKKPRAILINIVVPITITFPIMLQPDFGSTFLILLISCFMLFVAGLPVKYILMGTTVAMAALLTAILHAPYRIARITSFLEPWENLHRGGFQIIQSYLGFQNGGLLGLGVGESRQKLYFLPEAHTDFILAVIGEEFGLFGVIFIICCFVLLLDIGIKVAMRQKRAYRRLLAFGCTSLIAVQACFNMGVVMGLLPTKGIPLPFVSSGASSLSVFLIIIGILSRLDNGEPYRDGKKER